MPGFMPGIHVFLSAKQVVDGRDKPGHDEDTQLLRVQFLLLHSTDKTQP
jgi:hypothetical protein